MLVKRTLMLVAVAFTIVTATAAFAGRGNGNGYGNGNGGNGGGNRGGVCPYGQGAGGGNAGDPGTCPLYGDRIGGVVTDIDGANLEFVVDTGEGLVTVVMDANTVIKMGNTLLTFADLKVGQTVRAVGELDGGVMYAAQVNVRYRGR